MGPHRAASDLCRVYRLRVCVSPLLGLHRAASDCCRVYHISVYVSPLLGPHTELPLTVVVYTISVPVSVHCWDHRAASDRCHVYHLRACLSPLLGPQSCLQPLSCIPSPYLSQSTVGTTELPPTVVYTISVSVSVHCWDHRAASNRCRVYHLRACLSPLLGPQSCLQPLSCIPYPYLSQSTVGTTELPPTVVVYTISVPVSVHCWDHRAASNRCRVYHLRICLSPLLGPSPLRRQALWRCGRGRIRFHEQQDQLKFLELLVVALPQQAVGATTPGTKSPRWGETRDTPQRYPPIHPTSSSSSCSHVLASLAKRVEALALL